METLTFNEEHSDLLSLQEQTDTLRSKLKGMSKLNKFDDNLHKQLNHLDGLFNRLCLSRNLKLSKTGRLTEFLN